MCRLLMLYNPGGIDPNPALDEFRALSEHSKEYQGHGWGCAWLNTDDRWEFHHSIDPAWEDSRDGFPLTRLFLAHARSAFQNEGIAVENNMPFTDGDSVFIFNGELRGVKVKAQGRIGAEKVFNYIKRFNHGDMAAAVRRGAGIIVKRTRYIRAMNFILASPQAAHVCSLFNEDPDYFQLQSASYGDVRIVCSERYPLPVEWGDVWMPLRNNSFQSIPIVSHVSSLP